MCSAFQPRRQHLQQGRLRAWMAEQILMSMGFSHTRHSLDTFAAPTDCCVVLRRLIVVMGCIHLLGGSFGVLQIVAWAGMLADYSSTDGIVEGITMTFDGEHPCSLCLAIVDAKSKEQQKNPLQSASDKLSLKDLTLPQQLTLRDPKSRPEDSPRFSDPADGSRSRSDLPPVPPPRLVG